MEVSSIKYDKKKQTQNNQTTKSAEAWMSMSLTQFEFVLYSCDFISKSIFDTVITCKTLEINNLSLIL